MSAFHLPAWSDDDALPHDRAVWREYPGAVPAYTSGKRVCLEYGDGSIAIGMGQHVDWTGCKRWRFGWPPR